MCTFYFSALLSLIYIYFVIRFPNAIQPKGVKIFRFDADIFFVNSSVFERQVKKKCLIRGVQHVILDFAPVSHVDSTAFHVLEKVLEVRKFDRDSTFLLGQYAVCHSIPCFILGLCFMFIYFLWRLLLITVLILDSILFCFFLKKYIFKKKMSKWMKASALFRY